ncbi:ABC transporter permease [Bacillus sp. JR_15]|uniref:ABC transporter permease n=1 Tax=Bacillus TaxID=1386 RepID=UPI0020A10C00|nr:MULTISPECIES: ABC transporter permease [Bacillus]MCP1527635.1 sodium transport system permease protein [Bacillus pumilus]MCY7437248.1 ABC transporter permease [Bacillus pumilus]MDF9786801.1 sodium transport system permease protein [Bacillus pumilus]MDR6748441.1 sodium transport system permease protein [Bacillus pumilus]
MWKTVFLKEMTDALRDRKTLLLTVLIPLLTMLGLVFFYESMIADPGNETYTVAVNEQLPTEMNQMIKEVKNLTLETFDDPQQAVKDGKANAYLEMPKEADDMLQHQQSFAIKIHGYTTDDDSVITVQMLQSLLEQYQNQVVEKRLAADQINTSVVHPFQVQAVDVEEGDEGENGMTSMLLSILLPMILVTSVISGALPAALDIVAGEKDRKSIEALFLTPASRLQILIGKWLAVSMFGILSGIVAIGMLLLSTLLFTEKLKQALNFGDQMWSIIGVMFAALIIFSFMVSMIELLLSVVSSSVKEAQSYMSMIITLGVIPMFFTMRAGATQLDTYYFAVPFLNIHALCKQLMFGIIDPMAVTLTLGSSALAVVILFVIVRSLFMKEKWMLAK